MRLPYRLAVDIGGTFTDGVLQDVERGEVFLAKSLTTYTDPGEAVSTVVGDLIAAARGGSREIGEVVHATTLVTNAIIARQGAKTALLVTRGFADTLDIRREDRYDLFDLDLRYPDPLVAQEHRIEVAERMGARGEVVEALDQAEIDRVVELLRRLRPEALAICFLHSYANDAHEAAMAAAVRAALPGLKISTSSQTAREIREFERMSTVTANAYVQPLTHDYLQALGRRMDEQGVGGTLRIMVSSGGFTSPEFAAQEPVKLLESGPAAGVLSAINTASAAGVEHLLAFDMGGTTAKACVAVNGVPEITNIFEAGGYEALCQGEWAADHRAVDRPY